MTWKRSLSGLLCAFNLKAQGTEVQQPEYDTARRAIITDLTSLSHTITELTAGTDYTVRVAVVNQADATHFTDADGRGRVAELIGTPR